MTIHLGERVTNVFAPEGATRVPWIVTACQADGLVQIERELLDGSLGVKMTRTVETLRAWTEEDQSLYLDQAAAHLEKQREIILRMADAADELAHNIEKARTLGELRSFAAVQ